MPSSLVTALANFIMTGGPITNAWSTAGPRPATILIPSVASPFVPLEPSSVITSTSSLTFPISSTITSRPAVRAHSTVRTLLPAS